MEKNFKQVIVEIDPTEWHGHGTETLWAEELANNTFRVKNIPFYAKNISLEDTILTEQREGNWFVKFIKERGGHSTCRIIINKNITAEKFREYWELLEKIGCTYEKGEGRLFAIDIPPGADIYDAYRLLEKGEANEIWDFEEAHCGHPLKD